jgi:hypothetical protein
VWVDADDNDVDDDEAGDGDEEMMIVDDRDHAEDGDGELPTLVPWRSELLAPRTPPVLSVDVHVCTPPADYKSEEPQTPVPYLYEWEATPTPYLEAAREREREGEQVGGKQKRWPPRRHVRHDAPSAFPESSSDSVSEYCIHPRLLARHDRSRSLPPLSLLYLSYLLCITQN